MILLALNIYFSVVAAGQSTCEYHPNSAFANATSVAVLRGIDNAACCAACAFDLQCKLYNFHPLGDAGQPTYCQLLSAGTLTSWNPARNFSAGSVTKRPPICTDAHDCSLAGACVDGKCRCDGWTHGPRCDILNLLPADTNTYGYRNSSGYNSWGGASIPYKGKWYLFASQIINKCPLNGYWDGGSEAIRAMSATGPMGPFSAVETVIPRMAHNIKPFQAPDGTWLIYYIGEPNHDNPRGKYNCSGKPPAAAMVKGQHTSDTAPPQPMQTAGPVMVASAPSPDAAASAWTHHGPLTDSVQWHSATNPSPVFYPNGSVLLAVSRAWGGVNASCKGKRTVLMVADTWRGPYRNLSWTNTCEGAIDSGEDPDLFRTSRGFHMLNHNSGPGSTRLLFSKDGLHEWHRAFVDAFNTTIRWSNGTTTTVCRRQRPQIVFAEDGMPGWLWTGVGDSSPNSPSCFKNPTWTLVQKIGRPTDSPTFRN